MAASVRDTGDKLRKEVNEAKKVVDNLEKKKLISDKLIRSLQEDIGQLKNNLSIGTAENKKIKEENELINKKIVDLEDEILNKDKALCDVHEKLEKISTSNSKNSLKDELESIPFFPCDQCDTTLVSLEEFKAHTKTKHEDKLSKKVALLQKMQSLRETISHQKENLMSSILELKTKEFHENPGCGCRGFCYIDHTKYNFNKCKSRNFFEKIKQISNISGIDTSLQHQDLGQQNSSFKCNICEQKFTKKKDLRKHLRRRHTVIEGTPSNNIATNDAQIIEVDENKTDESDYSDCTSSETCQSSPFSSEETENSEAEEVE